MISLKVVILLAHSPFPKVIDLVNAGASFNNLLDALDASYCTFKGGDDPTQDGIYPDPLPGGFDQPESCGIVKPANVISTSYASDEADMTPAYSIRQCNEYGKLGLMGVTILYSSGDEGVAGNSNRCLNPDGMSVFIFIYPIHFQGIDIHTLWQVRKLATVLASTLFSQPCAPLSLLLVLPKSTQTPQ